MRRLMPSKSKEKSERLVKLADFLSDFLTANISMHDEIKSIQSSLLFQMESWSKQQESWEKRLEQMEDIRKAQLVATDEQRKKLEDKERDGYSLTDKTFVPHILGTVQVIHEELAKISKALEHYEKGISTMDNRIISVEMNTAVVSEKMDLLEKQLTVMQDFNRGITGKLIRLLILAFAAICALAGLGSLFDMIRFGG